MSKENPYDGYRLSNCCGEPIADNSDICSACKEHCVTQCSECDEPCENKKSIDELL